MNIETLYAAYLRHPVVTTDSRHCPSGSMFFALKGETFDGNAYAAAALQAGCAVAVVDDLSVLPTAPDERYIFVPDVLAALQQLAAHHRRTLHIPMLQITGTNGKTTTKELIAAVLSRRFRTLFTEGNLNNHIGVPRTLLRLTAEHEIAVIETGANHPGEIAFLSSLVAPDYGLVTNVGRAHLEGFGSFEGVKRTKGELYDYLRAHGGSLFLHADSADLCEMAAGLSAIRYGTSSASSLDVEGEACGNGSFLAFRWRTPDTPWHTVTTHLVGDYNLPNALAAITVGLHFGVAPEEIDEALTTYLPGNNRSQFLDTGRNRLIIDAYNANPTSMRVALDNFARMNVPRKWAILGAMKELGADSVREHQAVIDYLRTASLEQVWLVGEEFAALEPPFRTFATADEVRTVLLSSPPEDFTFLIKGSNSTSLFTLPEVL